MSCERLMLPIYCADCVMDWKRRIGIRLDRKLRAYDPVKEINSHLIPNDHLEALLLHLSAWMTSYRSLVRPLTPLWVSASQRKGV